LIFPENATMDECFIVNFFFKNETTEIRHLDLQRHFELFQKSFSIICLYLMAKQNLEQPFEKS
jgi:hypothetical protein